MEKLMIAPGTSISVAEGVTYTFSVTYSDNLELVHSKVLSFERLKDGTYWLNQEDGTIVEIPSGKYLSLSASKQRVA